MTWMNKRWARFGSGLGAAALAVTLGASGCTKHASQEDLQQLEEARRAAESAEEAVEAKRQEKQQPEAELNEVRARLEKAEADRDMVKMKTGM
jgi:septal ring factor EnvC (AmiA/AmiB activator)